MEGRFGGMPQGIALGHTCLRNLLRAFQLLRSVDERTEETNHVFERAGITFMVRV
jgi:hypothetical protein